MVAFVWLVTRGPKLGGGALVVVLVCLSGWYLVSSSEFVLHIGPRLPRRVRNFLAPRPSPSPRMANLPNLYLWAWERPEDLRFLGGSKVGVAFLAKTIYLTSRASKSSRAEMDALNIRPRMQPLRVVPGTPLMAVVRIESNRGAVPGGHPDTITSPSSFSAEQISRIATEIANAAQVTGATALQIDFDATTSEHAFYRDLLIEVHKELPPNFPLSITALASWCIGDRWLEQLPPGTIDEAVPILFRMGPEAKEIESYIQSGADFRVAACGGSLGVSTDEPFSIRILKDKNYFGIDGRKQRRVYVFSPKSWDKDSALAVTGEVN